MIGCLLLHGFTGRSEEIAPLINYLERETDWEIIAPVLPGHGNQLNLKGKDYSMWIDKAVDELHYLKKHCEKVFVIGFSMGAMIAVQLANQYTIDRLVLLAPAAKVLPMPKMVLEINKMLRDAKRGILHSNLMYQHSVQKIIYTPMEAVLEFFKLIKQSKKCLYDIDVPVLIMQGKQDALVPYKTIYEFDRVIQSTEKEIVLFQDAGHFICLEKDTGRIVNRLALEFLKKH